MFEQDYIMRLIREIARLIAKILFNIDSETITEDLENRLEETDILEKLLSMIDAGKVNEAENDLYELIDENSPNCIEIALLFYSYLNDKSDEFLKGNNYSREEIQYGLEYVAKNVGLSGFLTEM